MSFSRHANVYLIRVKGDVLVRVLHIYIYGFEFRPVFTILGVCIQSKLLKVTPVFTILSVCIQSIPLKVIFI